MRIGELHHEDMSTMINTYKMSMKEILLKKNTFIDKDI
jgi:hypothetical protein